MRLAELKPNGIVREPGEGIPALLRNLLLRTQFVPGIRYSLGWRGIRPSNAYAHVWTFRLKGFQGVFGLYPREQRSHAEWAARGFGICYFPHPREPLVERFSLAAGICAFQAGFSEKLGDFPAHEELVRLFTIGFLSIAVDAEEQALLLGLDAQSRDRIIAVDGIATAGDPPYVVEPGAADQHLPSFTIAFGLFKALAATAAYHLGTPPDLLLREFRRGVLYACDRWGRCEERVDAAHHRIGLTLGFGVEAPHAAPEVLAAEDAPALSRVRWRSGDGAPPAFCRDALWWRAHELDDLKHYDKRSLGIDDRPDLYVVSGFLGAGKTSFLQHFLDYQVQRGRFVAVLQNEFGEVGLDGKLLDQAFSVTELNEGTVCCSLVGELRPAIHKLVQEFQPDLIVLETSGAANPIGLREDLRELEEWVRLDSLTTVVDAACFDETLEHYLVAADQIAAADLILLNKRDAVDEDTLERITRRIRGLNDAAPVVPTRQGYIDPSIAFEFGLNQDHGAERADSETAAAHPHPHPAQHRHDAIENLQIPYRHPVDARALIRLLESLPASVFRVKGIVDTAPSKPCLVQFVGGRYELSEFRNPSVTERFLVLIGQDLDASAAGFRDLRYMNIRVPETAAR